MTLDLYSSALGETVEASFPQLRKAAEWVIWMLPAGPVWEPGDASRILSAFQDLRCIAWLASEGGGDTPAIKNHLRAFGQFPGAAKNVLVQRSLNYLSAKKNIYSDIAWFDSEHGASFASFFPEVQRERIAPYLLFRMMSGQLKIGVRRLPGLSGRGC